MNALLVGTIYGVLIARVAPVSGALGGCQSEIGVASAMAAAALVQLAGGTPERNRPRRWPWPSRVCWGWRAIRWPDRWRFPASSETPSAWPMRWPRPTWPWPASESVVPPDEVILALRNVQTLLPMELRDTTLGGLGITPTAQRLGRMAKAGMARCSGRRGASARPRRGELSRAPRRDARSKGG